MDQIARDAHRISYLSYTTNIEQIKERLKSTDHLDGDKFSYAQGDFTGEVFSWSEEISKKYRDSILNATTENTYKDFKKTLCTNYEDDEGNLCGFAIIAVRNDPKPGDVPVVPVEERSYHYTVTHIKYVNQAGEHKDVTHLYPSDFVTDQGTEISDQDIADTVNKKINSKKLSQLLAPIFNGDTLHMASFDALRSRISLNRNIDNLDMKMPLFSKFVAFAHNIKPDSQTVQDLMRRLEKDSQENANFYKDGEFEKTIETIFAAINEEVETEEEKHTTKLFHNAIKISLLASTFNGSNAYLQPIYLAQAQELFDLVKTPTEKLALFYGQMELEDSVFQAIFEDKKLKLKQFWDLLNEKQKINDTDPNFVEKLGKIRREKPLQMGFFDNTDSILENLSVELDADLEEISKRRKKHFKGLNDKLAEFMILLPQDYPDYLYEGLAQMAQNLPRYQNEPTKDSKRYENMSFEDLVFSSLKAAADNQISSIRASHNQNLKDHKPLPLKQQSFLRRNGGAIALSFVALLLLTTSLILVLTGVLAPLGIALTAGTATTIAAVGVFVAAISAVKIVLNQILNNIKRTKHDNALKTFNQFNDQSNAACQNDISNVNMQLQQAKEQAKENFKMLQEPVANDVSQEVKAIDLFEDEIEEDLESLYRKLDSTLLEGENLVETASNDIVHNLLEREEQHHTGFFSKNDDVEDQLQNQLHLEQIK